MGFRAQGFEGLYGLGVWPAFHLFLTNIVDMPWQGCSGYHRGGEKAGCLLCTQGGHFSELGSCARILGHKQRRRSPTEGLNQKEPK